MPRKVRIDMVGLRHGRLVGIGFSHNERGHAHWMFLCDCGSEVVVDGSSVRAGSTSSCGCMHREICAARLTIHGRRADKWHDPTYRVWQAMNDACFDPASPKFRGCGDQGIRVGACWHHDFEAFVADMGERPGGTLLERLDKAADFGPENCCWVLARSRSRRAVDGWARRKERPDAGRRPRRADWAPLAQFDGA